ncbi:HPr family phosphocarrier protein [Thermodesulforhabdus norvegica]|uniref:Phosphocarrier protein n=1 Tax=Thermodesulforhabdus norvegica TaxID=39841 RepID=A0A1I4W2N3_9BACT|nr:HPr family phosphocarrier protein [Thermodesulforhabdus norvegica]SFN07705.1 phosphocarrier protein [Thermodesulforhabdus norvegica]
MALSREFTVSNRRGIHARVAAKIVEVVEKFSSDVTLRKGDLQANARSILDILSLACGCGTRITVEAKGPDEVMVIAALEELFKKKFGEV